MISILVILLPILAIALDDGGDIITQIKGPDAFNSKVIESPSLWLVQFYDSTVKSSQDSHKFSTLATLLHGIIPTALVDVNDAENMQMKAGMSASASLKLFGGDKTSPIDLTGTKNANDILNRCLQEIGKTVQIRGGGKPKSSSSSHDTSGSKVVTVTSSNISETIYENPLVTAVAFVAPWCGHCKSLLPEWAQASLKLDGNGAQLAVVDATVEEDLARQYGVQGFPTIRIFPGGTGKGPSDALEYEGGREQHQIVQYVLEEVDRSGVPKEILELTSKEVMEEVCVGGGSTLCVLFALPHILDSGAEGRNKYKEVMTKATKAVRGMGFSYAWFEGGSEQGKLETALGLDFGFPAVVAYSHKKGVYIPNRFSFQESNIRKFLLGLTSGKQQSFKIDEVPVVKTVEPWDGQDGVPLEEESLADIMGDDWDEEF